MEIRLRNIPPASRIMAVQMAHDYERKHMEGRGLGWRNCVVWALDDGTYIGYHTKTGIVIDFREKG